MTVYRWAYIALALAIGCAAAVLYLGQPAPIGGVATVDQGVVAAVKEERRVAAEKQLAAAAATKLAQLETETRESMQAFFRDPENGMDSLDIAISEVGLIKVGENLYEGLATMSSNGGTSRDIPVKVKADTRTSMWSTEPGALAPLFE